MMRALPPVLAPPKRSGSMTELLVIVGLPAVLLSRHW
jgi:hypothetical protein